MTQQLPMPTLQPTVRGLSDEQVRAVHYATLEILTQTGVEMRDPQGIGRNGRGGGYGCKTMIRFS